MDTLTKITKYTIVTPLAVLGCGIVVVMAAGALTAIAVLIIGLIIAAIPTVIVLAILCAPIYFAFVLCDAIYEHMKLTRQIKKAEQKLEELKEKKKRGNQ